MHRSALAVALLVAGLTCACAGPKFYTLENGKERETGIPIYPTRIFLVVSYTNAKDHPVEVTLVRIPDRTQEPSRAGYSSRWAANRIRRQPTP